MFYELVGSGKKKDGRRKKKVRDRKSRDRSRIAAMRCFVFHCLKIFNAEYPIGNHKFLVSFVSISSIFICFSMLFSAYKQTSTTLSLTVTLSVVEGCVAEGCVILRFS
jgi:hypothetical protein